MMKYKKTINADVVVCEEKAQVLVENEVDIDDLQQLLEPVIVAINFDRVHPLRDKIIVQGTIEKKLLYVSTEDDGVVRAIEEEIPFTADINCPGFTPGSVHNERRYNTGNNYRFFIDRVFVDQIVIDDDTVLQKVVLDFTVKVLRQEQLDYWAKCKPVFHCTSDCTFEC